jgi:hypothetical protein
MWLGRSLAFEVCYSLGAFGHVAFLDSSSAKRDGQHLPPEYIGTDVRSVL